MGNWTTIWRRRDVITSALRRRASATVLLLEEGLAEQRDVRVPWVVIKPTPTSVLRLSSEIGGNPARVFASLLPAGLPAATFMFCSSGEFMNLQTIVRSQDAPGLRTRAQPSSVAMNSSCGYTSVTG
jgi:hypothetical protein